MSANLAQEEYSSFSGISPFSVELDFFSGPLDLLLHLVNREEVSIEKVDMTSIASQYLEIISRMQLLDLHVATEYLVIAATLLAIKSQSLLAEGGYLENSEFEEGSEFYEELRARLKRYEEVKLQALYFRALPQLGRDTFQRVLRGNAAPSAEVLTGDEDSQSLALAFVKLLKRIGATLDSLRIQLEPVSIVNYMMRIIQTLQTAVLPSGAVILNGAVPRTFFGLLAMFRKTDHSEAGEQRIVNYRRVVIGSFIAMLELMKRGIVTAFQHGDVADIELNLAIAEPQPLESEFDEMVDEVLAEERSEKVVDIERYRTNNSELDDFTAKRKEVNRD